MLYNDNYYIRPKEASRKLSMAYKIRTPVYMYGVTGSGKTALVKDFLAHKKYSVFSAAKVSPEEINISKDGKEKIVVIDDLHFVTGVSERKSYEELIIKLLEQGNIWLLLISRSPMPGWLISIYIHYAFITIPESDFYLTREEQILFLKENNIILNEKQEDEIIKFTEGFPIAIRLLAINGGDLRTATQELCNYLESYVYDQWDIELQEFFMQTSIVDNFTEELASMITGKSNVAVLLARAQEMGNFFVSDGVNGIWEYRWQMRDSMRLRLKKKWNNERINPLYHHAGLYYEMHDKIPEALSMYEQCNDKESISRVLIANARKNPASGHYFEMRKYYLSLPEEKILENPLLIAGMSMLQSMLMNIDESERWYEALKDFAKNHICSERREAKSRLLYLDIGLPHRGIVNLVDILKHAGTLIKDRGATLPEFSVTSNLPSMMNGGKDFCDWSKHDNELAASIGKMVEFVLGKYGKGLVSLALAESYLEKGMDGYSVMTLAEKGKLAAESGGKIEQCFVATGILVWLSIINGNADYAEEQLLVFRERAEKEAERLLFNIDAMLCRIYLYQCKYPKINEWMKTAPQENAEFSTMERLRYLTKARVYLQMGKLNQACSILEKMLYYADVIKRTYIMIESYLLLSIAWYRMGRKDWTVNLQKCIDMSEEYGFVRIISREGIAVIKLLKSNKLVWKNEDFKNRVISECAQMAEFYPKYLERGTDGEIKLSENALKILKMQAEGMSIKNIAERLSIKESTVKYHCGETYRKLNAKSKLEAINEARKRNLI